MELLKDIIETVLGRNEDETNQINESIETELTLDDDESTIEREIIKCQRKNGRLLIQTSRALRNKYRNMACLCANAHSDKVDRTILRLAKRRYRGHCSVKAEDEKMARTLKPIIDQIFKKKEEEFNHMAL